MSNLFSIVFYLLFVVMLVGSILQIYVGVRSYRAFLPKEKALPWYNYSPILQRIGTAFMLGFYSLFIEEMQLPGSFLRILLLVLALICGMTALGIWIQASRYRALLPQQEKKKNRENAKAVDEESGDPLRKGSSLSSSTAFAFL